jgi:hypothetical protein
MAAAIMIFSLPAIAQQGYLFNGQLQTAQPTIQPVTKLDRASNN